MKSIYAVAALGTALILGACERTLSEPNDLEPSLAAVGTLPSGVPIGSRTYPTVNRLLAEVRQATARYQDFNTALADGYQPLSPCVAVPGLGGMGFHYGKMALMADADFTPTEPEVLLYEPQPDGQMKLVGVEYLVVQAAWHGAGNTGRPQLLGESFDILPGNPEAGTPDMYALHAWAWQPNPMGAFAPFNPRVSCTPEQQPESHSNRHNH